MIHDLKIWPEYFNVILSGEKTFELRKDDRGFRAGDTLLLKEWTQHGGYTGREKAFVVTYVLSGFGLQDGWVVMAIKPIKDKP